MKSAARGFYLAVFVLLGGSHAAAKSTASSPSDSKQCAISPEAIVSDACVSYSTLEEINNDLKPALDSVTQTTDFFAYYRLDLFSKTCPFWSDENGMCGNIACAVSTLENEDDIPPVWRADSLGRLEGPKARHPGRQAQEREPERPLGGMLGADVGESCVVEYDDERDERDYCVPEDERAGAKGDYVSLVDNPERFTGYSGAGATQVWDAIYRENCFSRSSHADEPVSRVGGGGGGGGPAFGAARPAVQDLRSAFKEGGRRQALQETRKVAPNTPFVASTGLELLAGGGGGGGGGDGLLDADDGQCLEKRVFHRIISGMHASISAHICRDYLNQTTGRWGPNLQCYRDRLHAHPERLANLYFNYALVLRAVTKLGPHLAGHTFCAGDAAQDRATRRKVGELTAQAARAAAPAQIFDERRMFVDGEGPSLKEDFRNRFRNVSRLMDCVGCDKCRLWGKVQTAGYGAAMKVLFEYNDGDEVEVPTLKRTELVALFNTLSRISSSLSAVADFRSMVEEEEKREEGIAEIEHGAEFQVLTDREKKPHHVVVDHDFADAGEDDDDITRRHDPADQSIKEAFLTELDLVMRAFKFILRSYINIPRNLWTVFVSEMTRSWEWYAGLPVTPRTWSLKAPRHEEL